MNHIPDADTEDTIKIEFELSKNCSLLQVANALNGTANALGRIVGALLSNGTVTAAEPVLPHLLNAAQLMEASAKAIQGGPQIAQPQILGPGMGPRGPVRMN